MKFSERLTSQWIWPAVHPVQPQYQGLTDAEVDKETRSTPQGYPLSLILLALTVVSVSVWLLTLFAMAPGAPLPRPTHVKFEDQPDCLDDDGLSAVAAGHAGNECAVWSNEMRFDCFPQAGANRDECQARGCCWLEPKLESDSRPNPADVPYCFYPANYRSYRWVNSTQTGVDAWVVQYEMTQKSPYPADVVLVSVEVRVVDRSTIQVKIKDANHARYEIPDRMAPVTSNSDPPELADDFVVSFVKDSFGFKISRKHSGYVLYGQPMQLRIDMIII
ncbi:hypothetical protein TCAL_16537 [Tigriopus californicus]|uniref:P-type domain-containing protein n=1 Tax=Tigriopus californicus TaxID=6832 RepID=A0A553NT24_TIGCA|nr:hypothetical protein TCAL_16537 [Tigriopus californicus]